MPCSLFTVTVVDIKSACLRITTRYHPGHQCTDVDSACRDFRDVIDSVIISTGHSVTSCSQAMNRLEEDGHSFDTAMFQTTGQVRQSINQSLNQFC